MQELVHAVGKRKTAIARVWVKPGKGAVTINNRPMADYYTRETSKMVAMQPLVIMDIVDKYDIKITVSGGGLSGQAGAIRHAITKALVAMDSEAKPVLKSHQLLTRDARKKERKLPGQKGARARFQFSKR